MKSDHIIGKRKVGTFHIPPQNAPIPQDDLPIFALTSIFHKTQKLFILSNFPFNHIYISLGTSCHLNFKPKYSFLKKILVT